MLALKVVVANSVRESIRKDSENHIEIYLLAVSTHCLMIERIYLCEEAVGYA